VFVRGTNLTDELYPEIAVLPDGRRVVIWEEGRQTEGDDETVRNLRARVAVPASDTWGPPVTVASGGTFPRVAVAPDGRTALAFTRLAGDPAAGAASEIVVVDLDPQLPAG